MKDLKGKKFGRLIVLRRGDKVVPGVGRLWICRCKCGKTCERRTSQLNRGVSSCGCLRSDSLRIRHRKGLMPYRGPVTHGGRNLPEYGVWVGMIRRCEDTARREYPRYGGAGVQVCERWRFSFAAFLADMGRRPSKFHTLERKDNKIGYGPGNCVWGTRKDQTRNRSCTVFLDYLGTKASIAEWAEKHGFTVSCLRQRHARGWSPDRILETPAQRV